MDKNIFLILCFILPLNFLVAQDNVTKKEKKEQEKLVKEAQKQEMLALVNSRMFVLEATRVQDNSGQVLTLTPTTNFLSVMDTDVTIQFALDGAVGWNGLGGITLSGILGSIKVNEGKPGKQFNVTMRISGAGMYSHQFLTVFPDGRGNLEVNGDGGARFVFNGKVIPYSESVIYKGMPSNK